MPSEYVNIAQLSFGAKVYCHCDSWAVCVPCYFSLEQNLSLPWGILKFPNEVPWHGFLQSFYCASSEPITFWNMSISSKKTFKWFLWKFLHAFLSGTPTIWLLDLQITFNLVLLFSISLSFCFTFRKFFFNTSFLAFYWIFLFMSTIRKL